MYKRQGLGIKNVIKSGRPRVLSKIDERKLVTLSKADPSLSANTLGCSANLSVKASLSTVKRSLRRNNLFGRVAARKPWLTGAQIRKRQVWCLDKIKWSDTKLKSIIYIDECCLDLLPRQGNWKAVSFKIHFKNQKV